MLVSCSCHATIVDELETFNFFISLRHLLEDGKLVPCCWLYPQVTSLLKNMTLTSPLKIQVLFGFITFPNHGEYI